MYNAGAQEAIMFSGKKKAPGFKAKIHADVAAMERLGAVVVFMQEMHPDKEIDLPTGWQEVKTTSMIDMPPASLRFLYKADFDELLATTQEKVFPRAEHRRRRGALGRGR